MNCCGAKTKLILSALIYVLNSASKSAKTNWLFSNQKKSKLAFTCVVKSGIGPLKLLLETTKTNNPGIVVMDSGKVVEQGTHSQLISMNQRYATLYNQQDK